MSPNATDGYVAALTRGEGLHDDFIYSMTFDDYKSFPAPFPRTTFSVKEVEAHVKPIPQPREGRRALSLGHSRQTVYTGASVNLKTGPWL